MARSFGGGTDQIVTASYTMPTTNFSLSAWFNPSGFAGAYLGIIGQNNGGTGLNIYRKSSPGQMAYYFGAVSIDPGTATPANSVWTHVAATYDGTTLRTYINGTSDGTATGSAGISGSAALFIGADFSASRNFLGSIADAVQWKAVLTATEIYALARGARPYQIRPASIFRWFPLDGYGHPALDRSIYNFNGTITGTSFAVGPTLLNSAPIMLTTVNSGEAFLMRSPLMVAAALPKKGAAVASTVVFRKTLSQIGGRVGTRQIQGWAN